MVIKVKCKKCGHEDVIVCDTTEFLPVKCRECGLLNERNNPILETEILNETLDASLLSNEALELQNLKSSYSEVLAKKDIPRYYKKISQIDDMILFENRRTEGLVQFRVINSKGNTYYCR